VLGLTSLLGSCSARRPPTQQPIHPAPSTTTLSNPRFLAGSITTPAVGMRAAAEVP
jgi:hypothetical protein